MADKSRTKEQLVGELARLRQRLAELEAVEARRKLADGDEAILSHDLMTSLKELRCFYNVGAVAEESSSLDDFLDRVISLVPLALQYPELARAEIMLRDSKYHSEDFAESQYRISSDIKVAGEVVGNLVVYYTDDMQFLEEEVDLIRGIAERIGDVVGRVEAEEALQKSEELYRGVIESASDVIWTLSPEATITSLSPAFETIMGLACGEWIGKPIVSILHPDDLPLAMEKLQRALSGERVSPFELRFLSKSGVYWLAEVTGAPLILGVKVVGVLGIARDITERKKVEEELRESNRAISVLLSNLAGMAYRSRNDRNWTREIVSEGCFDLTGYQQSDLLSSGRVHYEQMIHPDDREYVRREVQVALSENRPFEFEYRIRTAGGEEKWVWEKGRGVLFPEGEPAVVEGFITDITERKISEEALQESQQFSSSLLDSSPNPILVINPDTSIKYVNPAMEKLTGFTSSELIGMKAPHPWWTEETRPNIRGDFEEVMYREEDRVEDVFQKRNGERFWVEITAKAIKREGKLEYHLTNWVDITERKQMEVERKELEQKAQQESRLASIGEMASGIAHEINNPLVGVVGFSQLLMERKDLPDDVRGQLKMIYDGGQRVASIVKRLLSFTRQRKPERTYVDINQTIKATLEMVAYEMGAAGIKVVTQLAPELPGTMADAGQFQQVFLNIIINAEKEMVLAHGKGNLLVKTETIDNAIRISFKDDGPGIAKENIDRIFDPFFTTRGVGQGTGLGLSVCHGVIAEHNGRIYAESKPGKGATFIVELPVICEDRQVEKAEPVTEEPGKVAKASYVTKPFDSKKLK